MSKELKPVKCGCGGEAEIKHYWQYRYYDDTPYFYIWCKKCHIKTDGYDTKDEAITAWNRAMGTDKDKITATKGYWMSTYDGLHCSVCNYKCETTASPSICPHCGTNMKIVNVYPCTTPNGTYTGGCTFTNTTDPNKDFHPVRDFMVGVERTAKVINIHQEYDLEGICFFDYGDCDNCGTQVQRGDRYCSECGARLEWE